MIHDLILAAAGNTSTTSPDLITTLIGAGPFGVLAALFIWGLVIPRKAYEDVSADRDYWREAWKQESEAHRKTREALTQSEKRNDAAVEAANTATRLLDGLQHAASARNDR